MKEVQLLYQLIKIFVRLGLLVFCRKISVNNRQLLRIKGPVFIAANHPNSFLDAIVIGSLFSRPVHFLARGDAFTKPGHARLLRLLNMIPVYRLTEGKENLSRNEQAFERSREILSSGGIVLIFIEGICVNKHTLQPFKKGAARIASENRELKDFRILPVAMAYDSFNRFGKAIRVNISQPIKAPTLFPFEGEAKNIQHFNEVLFAEIESNILLPAPADKRSTIETVLLLLPAAAGYLLHKGFYSLVKAIVKKKTEGTVFFDSVLFGVLLILYPLLLLLLCVLLWVLQVSPWLVLIVFIAPPLLAWVAGRKRAAKSIGTVFS